MARRRSVVLSGGARRGTGWFGGVASGTSGSTEVISSSGSLLFGTAVQAGVDGLTLIRTRGVFNARLSVLSGANAGYFGAFGIGKTTLPAITAGVASVPTPLTEDTWDGWLYYSFFHCFGQSATLGDSDNEWIRLVVDSKAMRKIAVDEVFYAAVEVTEVGTCVLDMNMDSRMLFKLQ